MKITANGISIHYMLEGAESAPVITLSHSLATDLTMWDPQMVSLLKSYRVLRYDTRGHGKTEAPQGPYSLELLVEDVLGLLRAYEAITYDMSRGIAQKCNLCHHRVDKGLLPACADNVCLAHCIHFRMEG